jgi:transglutaminase-like putative cysteine protease
MKYEVIHSTVYSATAEVLASQHLARLAPRGTDCQRTLEHSLTISPHPTDLRERLDYFGNRTTIFSLQAPYRELQVTARSLVEIVPPQAELPFESLEWEEVASRLRNAQHGTEAGSALEFSYASPLIPRHPDFLEYARHAFTPGRPLLEAAVELTGMIFHDFRFDPSATTIATPPLEVLKRRRGVCQDFAQVQIACLRSLGFAARYVSGYIETLPPPGQPKLVGADASHAWVSLWCPPLGWVDLDPTNNLRPTTQHITVGWGRDFNDISPLRGVFTSSGTQDLKVSVDVNRVP